MAEEYRVFEDAVFEEVEPTTVEAAEAEEMEGFGDEVSFEQEIQSCWGFGPLSVCASVIGSGQIRVTGSLFGRTILSGTLSTSRTRICASPSIGFAKAEICVVLDIRNRQVRVEGRLCIRRIFGRWRCSGFNSRILSW